ncbi:MAG: MoxR family ATPase [archaeon]|nr:MoxR family ATPase [archaeon]
MPELGPKSVDELVEKLREHKYIIDRANATPVFLAMRLQKPLLIEGPPGCGKTEIAKTVANSFGFELIRLQCYEGLDYSHAVYEWDYPRQLLEIKLQQEGGSKKNDEVRHTIYSENFLLERPLLKSIRTQNRTVLLVDEIDRADPEFEGFLLEFLSEYQVTIPELGTIKAESIPYVFITSNKTRDLSDAVKRRCLYLSLTYPSIDREVEILKKRVLDVPENLALQASQLVAKVRQDDELIRKPGTAETIDLVSSAMALGASSLTPEVLQKTAGAILKDEGDLARFLSSLL